MPSASSIDGNEESLGEMTILNRDKETDFMRILNGHPSPYKRPVKKLQSCLFS